MPPPQTPCLQKTTWLEALLQGQEVNPIPRNIPTSLLVWPVKNVGAKAWLIASLPVISLPGKEMFPKFSLRGMSCWQGGLNFMTHWAFRSLAARRPSRDPSLKTYTGRNRAVPKTSDSVVNERLSKNPGRLLGGKCPFSGSPQEEYEHRDTKGIVNWG